MSSRARAFASYQALPLAGRHHLYSWATIQRALRDQAAVRAVVARLAKLDTRTEAGIARLEKFLTDYRKADPALFLAPVLGLTKTELGIVEGWLDRRLVWSKSHGLLARGFREIEELDARELDELIALMKETGKREREVPEGAVVRSITVRCGKANCACSTGARHGPYRYAYWRENGVLRSRYLGRADGATRRTP